MRFSTYKRRRRTPTVIIVSLIDVLLVVLIFLMVTSTFKKEPNPVLKLVLPQSKTAQAGVGKEGKAVVILIGSNYPFFYFNNHAVTSDRLQTELATAVGRDPQVRVDIKPDRNAPTGELIKVLDAAKLANVRADSVSVFTLREGHP